MHECVVHSWNHKWHQQFIYMLIFWYVISSSTGRFCQFKKIQLKLCAIKRHKIHLSNNSIYTFLKKKKFGKTYDAVGRCVDFVLM